VEQPILHGRTVFVGDAVVVAVVVEPQQSQGVEDDEDGRAFVDEHDRTHR